MFGVQKRLDFTNFECYKYCYIMKYNQVFPFVILFSTVVRVSNITDRLLQGDYNNDQLY